MRYQAVSGFTVKGGKGDIAIKAGQTLDLPEDRAKTLINRGKIEAVSLKWDSLSKIHLSTARSLAGEGMSFKIASPAITQAEDALNKVWLDCLHGKASIDDFKEINRLWAETVRAVNERSKRGRLF